MSSDLNSIGIVGRLVRDVEVTYTSPGTVIAKFTVANTQSRKQGDNWVEEGHFFDCVGIGKRFGALQNYLNKGHQVGILGKLQQNRWQDKQTGQNRSRVEILVNDIQLLSGKPQLNQNEQGGDNTSSGSYSSPAATSDDFDDDIPF